MKLNVLQNQLSKLNANASTRVPDLVCLSHLRWDFVYQRPQHLMSRFAIERRVFFIEEPIFEDGPVRLDMSRRDCGVWIVVPRLPRELQGAGERLEAVQRELLDELFTEQSVREHVLWYYTPMALGWARHLQPLAIIYDCMDELSAFKGAPRALRERESELFARADIVFTGGQSLYEAKSELHSNIYAFPSSIDAAHFAQARDMSSVPEDQMSVPHPRLGFCGVIDERMNMELLAEVADARPDWHLVMIGPIVKINPADLPQRENIHYLGGKSYSELPAYLSGWDVALLPFALNESTKYISPTKTPEYLAAGRPVVSTSIRDVVRPYGEMGLVRIADTPAEFVAAIEKSLDEDREALTREADSFLSQTSWDRTWGRMRELIDDAVGARRTSFVTADSSTLVTQAARAALASSFTTGD